MSTQITQVANRKIYVNGKLVARDMNNEWITTEELTTNETKHLQNYLNANNLIND